MEDVEVIDSESDTDDSEDQPPLTPLGEKLRAQLAKAQRELDQATARIEDIQAEQAELEKEKTELHQRALVSRTVVETLEPLYREQEEEALEKHASEWERLQEAGIQECCYKVLLESKYPLEALDIKGELEELGIPMNYANPLAVIHTSLKRIPERVRSFKQRRRDPVTEKTGTVRYYEAIREKKKVAAAVQPAGQ